MNNTILYSRSRLMTILRHFFLEKGYKEINTPALSPVFIPEPTIPLFKTSAYGRRLFLLPSPELYHKRLLREGSGNIFEVCRSFRRMDFPGEHHNPEFTMLEWYTVGADYRDSLELTKELLIVLAEEFDRPGKPPYEYFTVAELFWNFCRIDLEDCEQADELHEECLRLEIPSEKSDSWEELYHRIFLSLIEPNLSDGGPIFLCDYPIQIGCLARKKENTPWRERWELYAGGLELANCFTEEVRGEQVEAYFREEAMKLPEELRHYVDWDFPLLFGPEFPNCSGVALGFDRLLMYCLGVTDIRKVLIPTGA